MKTFSYFVLTSFFTSSLFAQTMTGPGLNDQQPPTAGMEQQEDIVGGPQQLSSEDANAYKAKDWKKKNPQNEKGPHGKQAQEAIDNNQLDLSKKEIKRKQEGE